MDDRAAKAYSRAARARSDTKSSKLPPNGETASFRAQTLPTSLSDRSKISPTCARRPCWSIDDLGLRSGVCRLKHRNRRFISTDPVRCVGRRSRIIAARIVRARSVSSMSRHQMLVFRTASRRCKPCNDFMSVRRMGSLFPGRWLSWKSGANYHVGAGRHALRPCLER